MHGSVAGPVSEAERATMNALHDGYNMRAHTRADSPQAGLLDDDFVDRFAIVGPPDYCIERLRALEGLGMERIAISGPTAGSDAQAARTAINLMDAEVLPGLR